MKKIFPLLLAASILAFESSTFAMEENKFEGDPQSTSRSSTTRQIMLGNPLSIDDLNHIAEKKIIQTSQGIFRMVGIESCGVDQVIQFYPGLIQSLFDRDNKLIQVCNMNQLVEQSLEETNDKLGDGFFYYFGTMINRTSVDNYSVWGGKLTFEKIPD